MPDKEWGVYFTAVSTVHCTSFFTVRRELEYPSLSINLMGSLQGLRVSVGNKFLLKIQQVFMGLQRIHGRAAHEAWDQSSGNGAKRMSTTQSRYSHE